MLFTLFAVAALIWCAVVLLRTFTRSSSGSRPVIAPGIAVLILPTLSIVSDLRSVLLRFRAPESDVSVFLNDTGRWLQLAYANGKTSFVTANELHVPAGRVGEGEGRGPAVLGWSAPDPLPVESGRWRFIANDAGV